MIGFATNLVVTLIWGFLDVFTAKKTGDAYDKWATDADTKTP